MYKKFKSLTPGSEYSYCLDTEKYSSSNSPVLSTFRQFYTYGDGLTAHSESWPVQIEFIADFLASLAEAMLTDEQLSTELAFEFSRKPRLEQIEFAASVVYKAPKDERDRYIKRRYYSLEKLEISSKPDKEFDKRYHEIRENVHDGSPKAIYQILIPEYSNGLTKYLYAETIRTWAMEQDGLWMEMAAEFVGWVKDGDREKVREIRDAMEALQSLIEGRRLLASAESHLANLKRGIERRQAAKAVPTVASTDTPETAVQQ